MSKNHVGNVSSRTSGAHSPGRLPLPLVGHRKRPFRPFCFGPGARKLSGPGRRPHFTLVSAALYDSARKWQSTLLTKMFGGVCQIYCFGETARKPPECHHSHVFMCLRCVSKVVELEMSGMFWGSLSCLYLRVALLDSALLVHEQVSWASIMDRVQRAAFQLSLHAAYP
jgi:hypothetical protein